MSRYAGYTCSGTTTFQGDILRAGRLWEWRTGINGRPTTALAAIQVPSRPTSLAILTLINGVARPRQGDTGLVSNQPGSLVDHIDVNIRQLHTSAGTSPPTLHSCLAKSEPGPIAFHGSDAVCYGIRASPIFL